MAKNKLVGLVHKVDAVMDYPVKFVQTPNGYKASTIYNKHTYVVEGPTAVDAKTLLSDKVKSTVLRKVTR